MVRRQPPGLPRHRVRMRRQVPELLGSQMQKDQSCGSSQTARKTLMLRLPRAAQALNPDEPKVAATGFEGLLGVPFSVRGGVGCSGSFQGAFLGRGFGVLFG